MHSTTLSTTAIALALFTTPLLALPLRASAPFSPSPIARQQQNQRPFIATTWTPTSSNSHRKIHSSYPHPSPLATSTPRPPKPQQLEEDKSQDDDGQTEYRPICNLGHRTPVNIEDAVEVAYALCQGGIMDRSVVPSKDGGVGEEEVLECLACEVGTWNADKGEENK